MTAPTLTRPAAGGTRQHHAPHLTAWCCRTQPARQVDARALSEELDIARAVLASGGAGLTTVQERAALRVRVRVVKRQLVALLDAEATGSPSPTLVQPLQGEDASGLMDAADVGVQTLGVLAARALAHVPATPEFRFFATKDQAHAVREVADAHLVHVLSVMRVSLARIDSYGQSARPRALYAAHLVVDMKRRATA